MKEAQGDKAIIEKISELAGKTDKNRYKLGILQDRFSVPPDCDGWHDPEDMTLFCLGVRELLNEIMDDLAGVSDALYSMAR